jgi:hypothetical protein
MPAENIMKSLMTGGQLVPVPGGKGGKTFKAQTMSGILPLATGFPILVRGKPVPFAPLAAMIGNAEFREHREMAEKAGFSLYQKRAAVGSSKHIRVRPRFEAWQIVARLMVVDDQITTEALTRIVDGAGRFKGLGDWRPGGRTPGPYGTFEATVKQV